MTAQPGFGTFLGPFDRMSQVKSRTSPSVDVVCLSHLRWNFVFQRPQHLISRCARTRRVYFVEEPIVEPGTTPRLQISVSHGVTVVVPVVPEGLDSVAVSAAQRSLLDGFLAQEAITDYVLWYYTPMALPFTDHLTPRAVVYDCMDELSAFKGAPPAIKGLEAELLRRAAVVFTGGQSLYEAKQHQHPNIHAFPSSVDVAHFARARDIATEPDDQQSIGRPRLGFFGVIDERLDIPLLRGIADARPDWQFVMVGPVVKIDPATLPVRPNIYYLGGKQYDELPRYIAGWNVALLLFARNESTRFISPTKTPEYMAAGKPVVSTSIRDVVRPYGERGLVRIADDVEAFVAACEDAMEEDAFARLARFDAYLARMSWDRTWSRMQALLNEAILGGAAPPRRQDPQVGSTLAVGVPPLHAPSAPAAGAAARLAGGGDL